MTDKAQEIMALLDEYVRACQNETNYTNVMAAKAVRDKLESRLREVAAPPVPEPKWPTMPPSKGQSSVLFDDGYAEGWAKCMAMCRKAAEAATPQPAAKPPATEWNTEKGQRCPHCDGTGDVHSIDGQWRGRCYCPEGQASPSAQPAAKPAQPAPQTIVTERDPHPNAFMLVPKGTEIKAHWPSLTAQAEPVARDGWAAFQADWERKHGVPMNSRTRDDGSYGVSSIQHDWEKWLAVSPTQRRPQPLTYEQMGEFIEAHAEYHIAGWRVWGMNNLMAFIGKVEAHHGITAQEPTE